MHLKWAQPNLRAKGEARLRGPDRVILDPTHSQLGSPLRNISSHRPLLDSLLSRSLARSQIVTDPYIIALSLLFLLAIIPYTGLNPRHAPDLIRFASFL